MDFDAIEYTRKKRFDAPTSIWGKIPPTYNVCMHFHFNQKINSLCSSRVMAMKNQNYSGHAIKVRNIN